jgi:ketosteroid isomerase-like protein
VIGIAIALLAMTPAMAAPGPDGATETVAEFHSALDAGHARAMLELMAPDVVIYEQGFVESSRDAYANAHLGDDVDFASHTKREVVTTQSGGSGDSAWVITQSTTAGSYHDATIALQNTETMVLQRIGGDWKITHIHWSAHETPAAPPLAPPEPVAPQTPLVPEAPPAMPVPSP